MIFVKNAFKCFYLSKFSLLPYYFSFFPNFFFMLPFISQSLRFTIKITRCSHSFNDALPSHGVKPT